MVESDKRIYNLKKVAGVFSAVGVLTLVLNGCNEQQVDTKTGRMYVSQLYTKLVDCGYRGPKSSAQSAIIAAINYYNNNDSCSK